MRSAINAYPLGGANYGNHSKPACTCGHLRTWHRRGARAHQPCGICVCNDFREREEDEASTPSPREKRFEYIQTNVIPADPPPPPLPHHTWVRADCDSPVIGHPNLHTEECLKAMQRAQRYRESMRREGCHPQIGQYRGAAL